MHAFLLSGLGNLLRRQPDAVVDDLEADVSGLHGDLLCAIGMSVESGFADQEFEWTTQGVARVGDALPEMGDLVLLAEIARDDDAAVADEVFATLMGEDVEARRNFIQQNAKDVRFLDI